MSDIWIRSSKVARNVPCILLFVSGFLTMPRMPETVRMAAPSKRATSNADVNIDLMKAVFLNTLVGSPVSLSFLTVLKDLSTSTTEPVARIRKLLLWPLTPDCNTQKPVEGG
eukprot:Lithocolla_globosa_v1_NODE_5877_length_1171_cov_4.145161.p2 type:complete len:112 gc:universal NODE_5877_length_1171_cov_4.145161:536-871(+)